VNNSKESLNNNILKRYDTENSCALQASAPLLSRREIRLEEETMSALLDNEQEVNAQIEAVLSDDQDGEYDRHMPDRTILKMLVTDNIAGAIIGKNGKAIADIQEECGARIKVSQTADFYPGTSERTILITG
jgi:predicted PilT family ATPase